MNTMDSESSVRSCGNSLNSSAAHSAVICTFPADCNLVKLEAVPVAQAQENYTDCNPIITEEFLVKDDPVSNTLSENIEQLTNVTEYSSNEDESQDKKFIFETVAELNHSTCFREAWFTVFNPEKLICRRKSYETKEEYRRRKAALHTARKRANETPEKRKERLYKNALRIALRRSLQSEEEKQVERMKNALCAACKRMTETTEQRAKRKIKDAARAAHRRKSETEHQRMHRNEVQKVRAAIRRSKETPEQRASRLEANRERARKRRSLLKKTQDNTDVFNRNDDSNLDKLGNHFCTNNVNDVEQQAHDRNAHVKFIPIMEIKSEQTW